MFRFENLNSLYLLLLVPLIILLYFIVKRRYYKRLKLFGNIDTLSKLMPDASWRKTQYKFILISLSLIFFIIALARPQMGAQLREVKQKGLEIMFVVDVSNSMLADDYTPSRLEMTKNAINKLLDKFVSDRVGLVVFAGKAFVQLPITSDFIAAKGFVEYLSSDMIDAQGTSIDAALEVAYRSFSSDSKGSRAVILISDGEDHAGNATATAAKMAEDGIIISTIGIGTPSGVALKIGGTPITDEKGNIIVTKLNEDVLKEIAQISGGTYLRASSASLGVDQLVAQLRTIEQQEFSTSRFEAYNELYAYFLIAGLILIMLEFSLLERRNRVINKMKLFNIKEHKK